jgi:hypothetical protein
MNCREAWVQHEEYHLEYPTITNKKNNLLFIIHESHLRKHLAVRVH